MRHKQMVEDAIIHTHQIPDIGVNLSICAAGTTFLNLRFSSMGTRLSTFPSTFLELMHTEGRIRSCVRGEFVCMLLFSVPFSFSCA
jgi:hypothetical protein